jgi:hypothetical protein
VGVAASTHTSPATVIAKRLARTGHQGNL